MPRGIQRGNKEAKKPKMDKPKQPQAGYKSEGALSSSGGAKGSPYPDRKKPK